MIREYDIIRIFNIFHGKKGDVGLSPCEDQGYLISSIDTFVASTDMPEGMPYRSASYKSLLSAFSDLYVKGVSPQGAMISLGLPSLSQLEIEDLRKGFIKLLKSYRLPLSIVKKWDTNASKDLFISVAAYGFSSYAPPGWDAVEPGDYIYVGGLFGSEALGLNILMDHDLASSLPNELRIYAMNKFLYPSPAFDLYRSIVSRRYVNASIDSSDGLVRSLYILSKESKVKIVIEELPTDPYLIKYIDFLGINAVETYVLYGGEEYIGIFSVPPKYTKYIEQYEGVYRIGHVEKGFGVYIIKDNKYVRLEDKGYQHSFLI